MAAYVVVLAAVVVLGDLDGDSPWRFAWTLLPVLPAAWTVRVVLRHVRRVDEYQRLLLLESLAVGFAVAMLSALTLGFLAFAGLQPAATAWIVYGAGMLAWAVTGAVTGRR